MGMSLDACGNATSAEEAEARGYKLLCKHVENEAIRSRFETEAHGNGELCWNILDAECATPEDEMVSEQLKSTIQGSTILAASEMTDQQRR